MVILIWLFLLLFVIYTTLYLYRAEKFLFIYKKTKEENKKECSSNKKIIIALPLFREQVCVEKTVEYFKSIAKDIPIVLITTQREIVENAKNEITTQDIIKNKILPLYDNIYWINYPNTVGYMADQLNYMLNNLESIFPNSIDLKNTYLALYNADSRPSVNTFEEIKSKLKDENKVIQQYSYCLLNYNKLNWILKGFAVYQSNFEIKTGLINGMLDNYLFYTHVVGHGLIIELDTLKKLGNFNTRFWCEDIYLGLQLKFNSLKIIPLMNLENIETPDSILKLIKQNSVWFKTTSQFYKIYLDIKKRKQNKNLIKGFWGVMNEFKCAINWLGFPLLLLAILLIALIIKKYILFMCILITYFIYVIVNALTTIKIINVLDNQNYRVNLEMIVGLFVATMISNIGPLYSIMVNKKEKYKTER